MHESDQRSVRRGGQRRLGLGALFARLAALCLLISVFFLASAAAMAVLAPDLGWLAGRAGADPVALHRYTVSALVRAFAATAAVSVVMGVLGLRWPQGDVNWRPLAVATVALGAGLPLLAYVIARWSVSRIMAGHAPWP